VSPETEAAIIGGISGGLVGGIFTVIGGVVVLFWERRVRARGEVECLIGDEDNKHDWSAESSEFSAQHNRNIVLERRLEVLFLNGKDLPVTVLDMKVRFYKEGKPLEKEEQAISVKFLNAHNLRSDLSPLTLPPHVHVRRTLVVAPISPAAQWALDESDRAEFVAVLVGYADITRELAPWRQLPPKP
jgi:hypothetical protein